MEILLAVVLFGLLIAAMAIGVIMGRKPISGSCGGVGKALGEDNYTCDICGGDPNKCDEQADTTEKSTDTTDLAYDVSRKSSSDQ